MGRGHVRKKVPNDVASQQTTCRVIRRSQEGGIGIEGDANGDMPEEFGEAAFGAEPFHELAVLDQGVEDFGGNATTDQDAASSETFEHQVAGFGAVDTGEASKGFAGERIAMLQGVKTDLTGRVVGSA